MNDVIGAEYTGLLHSACMVGANANCTMQQISIRNYWPATKHQRWMSAEFVPGLVSVVLPTYNRHLLVQRGLNSIKQQSYRPIEVLVIDDGSTDATKDVVAEWAGRNTEECLAVHYFRQTNSGAPAARNLGLIESQGEFIQFLDSDDVLCQKNSSHVKALTQSVATSSGLLTL